MLNSLKLFSENLTYDELPAPHEILDEKGINNAFAIFKRYPTKKQLETLNVLTEHTGRLIPTIGGTLLFGLNRLKLYPDSMIRCARFKGTTKEKIIDHQEIVSSLSSAIPEVLAFIEKHTHTLKE